MMIWKCRNDDAEAKNYIDLRVFPAFVMDAVENRRFLVVGFAVFVLKDFGLVEQLAMEAKSTFVFSVSWLICRSHLNTREPVAGAVKFCGRVLIRSVMQRLLPEQYQRWEKCERGKRNAILDTDSRKYQAIVSVMENIEDLLFVMCG